jgi:hypothetical protein
MLSCPHCEIAFTLINLGLTPLAGGKYSESSETKMMEEVFPANHHVEIIFLGLQVFQVLFLWLHDWVPLEGLNDVAAVRTQDTTRRLIIVTLIQSVPFSIGLLFSALHLGRPYPHWLYMWLWISYGLIFVGQLRAWWIPYLLHVEPERAARYRVMFGKTHRFLPTHNGLVPNTAHIMLHVATAATLLTLLVN